MEERRLQIIKILNNNAVIAVNTDNSQVILLGRGIGHQHKKGDHISSTEVEETFVMTNKSLFPLVQNLLVKVPTSLIDTTSQIVRYGQKFLNVPINQSVIINLTDHLDNAITRARDGVFTPNPMNYDIKRFYPKEYQVGEYARRLVAKNHYTNLAEDEAGFIAMHFVDASLGKKRHPAVSKITSFVKTAVVMVQAALPNPVDESSLAWSRFLRHMQYMAIRVLEDHQDALKGDPELQDLVFSKYPTAHHIAENVKLKLQAEYQVKIGDNELMYMTMHIARLNPDEGE